MNHSGWLIEEQTPGYRTQWKVKRVLHEEQTPFQHLQVVEIEGFGPQPLPAQPGGGRWHRVGRRTV